MKLAAMANSTEQARVSGEAAKMGVVQNEEAEQAGKVAIGGTLEVAKAWIALLPKLMKDVEGTKSGQPEA
eukprot:scaffold293437_cov33-Tisochrysis_lutea.AAC.1